MNATRRDLTDTRLELNRLDFKAIKLDLKRPFVTAVRSITQREIIVLRATICVGETSAVGFGEVAPLPGWSEESIADCLAVLDTMAQPIHFEGIADIDAALPGLGETPTLRFGLELAILDALSRHQQMSISGLLGDLVGTEDSTPLPTSIPLQSTVGAVDIDALLAHAKQAPKRGYEYLKIKVGVDSLQDDIAKIAALCAYCPDLKLRLDANGAWSIGEALGVTDTLASQFPANCIDLVEQPVAPEDFDAFLTQFAAQSAQKAASPKFAIAADESANSFESAARLIKTGSMRAIVLKPATLGGLLPSAKLIALAQTHGVRVVLSTLLESAIGRRGIAQLGAAFPSLGGPHGLATGSWFEQDTATTPDRIEDAKLILSGTPGLGFEPTTPFSAKGATP